jgi:deoxycytidylate deaminase
MRLAVRYAYDNSQDLLMPTAAIIVQNDKPIAFGANGSDFHQLHGCARQVAGSSTGEDYDLCEGCHPKNHSESRAIRTAQTAHSEIKNAELYLWGHFGCCRSCWEVISEAEIAKVLILDNSEMLFNKKHPDNIVGDQFRHFRSYL